MLINADIKGLEVVVAAELSGDKVLSEEIREIKRDPTVPDIHERNRDRFGLGEGKPGRLIAKIFKFRLIYGGSAYSYAHDSDFMGVSTSEKFWQRVIDEYYEKYYGVKDWHIRLMQTARAEGRLEIPSGRFYPIAPKPNKRGELKWPDTVIKNYPVQGFGADLVMLARLRAKQLLAQSGLPALLVSTIHDSIVADTPDEHIEAVGRLLNQAVEDVPNLCLKTFDYEFKLPLTAEVQYGPNKYDMRDLTFS